MPWRNARRNPEAASGDKPAIQPMRQTFPPCCARAASGHAAAPPSSVMNSRRFVTARYHIAPRAASLIPIFFTTRTPCRSVISHQRADGGPFSEINWKASRRGGA